ncbi:MAG TPA: response regulator transcription factor [Chthoniobacterales bacterium]|jgi:DNA-binding NarL/FixJ family response regulator|nr:response regulator transcription factor [Chthoniobacterales bacterium]
MKSRTVKKAGVVIVEDHPMFREHLAQMINKADDLTVSGEADNIRDGFALIKRIKPSVAIVDITLKGSNGLELLKDLRAHHVNVPMLVLSMHDESLYAERALRAGARGYITKHEVSDKVMTAIRQVLKGDVYLSSRFTSEVMTKLMLGRNSSSDPIDRLADRELEVFELIGQGLTTREIAEQLHLGLTTVDTYKARIKEKLKLSNVARLRSEASRWVQQHE